eukprot:gene17644-biopygen5356
MPAVSLFLGPQPKHEFVVCSTSCHRKLDDGAPTQKQQHWRRGKTHCRGMTAATGYRVIVSRPSVCPKVLRNIRTRQVPPPDAGPHARAHPGPPELPALVRPPARLPSTASLVRWCRVDGQRHQSAAEPNCHASRRGSTRRAGRST